MSACSPLIIEEKIQGDIFKNLFFHMNCIFLQDKTLYFLRMSPALKNSNPMIFSFAFLIKVSNSTDKALK